MKNTGKVVAIGIVILLILFVASRFVGEMNPFDSPYKNLLDNVQKVNHQLGVATIRHDNELDRFFSLMYQEIENDTLDRNKGLLDTLDIIKSKKNQMINRLNESILKMEEFGEIDEETGILKRPTYSGENVKYWLDEHHIAENLHDALYRYFRFLEDMHNSQVSDETVKLKIKSLSNEPPTEWAENNFKGPVLLNISILRGLKMEVIDETYKALEGINTRVGVGPFKTDEVIAVSVPLSERVMAGTHFQTQLYPIMTSSSHQINYSSPNGAIATDIEGRTTLTIAASGNVIPKGKNEGKQSYSANLQIQKVNGEFQNLEVKGEFTVAKPEIVMNSAANLIMYRNCGNDFTINVPALGDAYNPKITATGAQAIPSKKTRTKFRIIPTEKTTRITVNSVTNGHTLKIGDVDYRVVNPPKPTINMVVNGKTYNGLTPIPKTSRVSIRIEPDADFKAGFPEDAKYGITSVDVLAQLSLGPPTAVNRINTSGRDATKPIQISLGTRVREARAGTKIYIRIDELYRVNFLKKRIPDPRFSDVEKNLSLVVK